MNQQPQQKPMGDVAQHSSGFFRELADRFRLVTRLMMDARVNPLVKILPVGALLYAIWPIDIPTPIDDVFVIWLGTTLFVQLCPPEVVEEHRRSLGIAAEDWKDVSSASQPGDVIDGEYFESDPSGPQRPR